MSILENFIKYVKIDTQSAEGVDYNPTTKKQFNLGNILVTELKELGVENAFIDEHCYVYGMIPSNTSSSTAVGLIAHLDTATEMSGANVNPQIIENYDGKDIILNKDLGIVMSVKEFPALVKYAGKTLITTDGTTLLGADDKAGVAIIMEVVKTLMENPEIPHSTILITFTPDEEVGMGTHTFYYDYYKQYNCTTAFTLDGDDINTINFENFNAASATITVKGKAIHPGSAKNKMINSMHLAMEFHSMLPVDMVPAKTEKYEGFNHLNHMEGTVEETVMHYIIRNHDMKKFEEQKNLFVTITNFLNNKYGEEFFTLDLQDSYFNMRELVLKNPLGLECAIKALQKEGIEPTLEPIRGGTDGARLTFGGITTPNLGTGGGNYHGKYEYVCLDDMKKMVSVVIRLLDIIK